MKARDGDAGPPARADALQSVPPTNASIRPQTSTANHDTSDNAPTILRDRAAPQQQRRGREPSSFDRNRGPEHGLVSKQNAAHAHVGQKRERNQAQLDVEDPLRALLRRGGDEEGQARDDIDRETRPPHAVKG